MKIYAYLRVSTDAQDVDNQKHGILEYANKHGFSNMIFVEDTVSGQKKWQLRKLGELVRMAEKGDIIIFAEISRMARSTLQVLEIMEHCTKHEIEVHVTKQNMILDKSMSSRITVTVLGMAAEIEREFISIRTKEALAKRKAAGLPMGRPSGQAETLRLDAKADEIADLMSKGVNKRSIAKVLGCSHTALYDWLDRRGIRERGTPRGQK
ncbi:MAG: resolvase [Thiothrix lacustris]|uniref:Resolvase n=1 Tax=Thiothrix lacustris TaxID=525917 RepID=A0A1Y1Q9F9_9GAMM|nr:MAG: resolvase [Thiothrix lacustris]